jgi:putative pyruvate formate lyase activating enzyme
LQFGPNGLATRGLLVRHLVMPGGVADTASIMKFLAEEISRDTYVNVMQQYHPEHKAVNYSEINRPIYSHEFEDAINAARAAGLCRLDRRSIEYARTLAEII